MLTKTIFWLLAVALVVLLGITVRHLLLGQGTEPMQSEVEPAVAFPVYDNKKSSKSDLKDSNVRSSESTTSHSSTPSSTMQEMAPQSPRIKSKMVLPPFQEHTISTAEIRSTDIEVVDPEAVIGRRISIDPSIEAVCNEKPTDDISCREARELLLLMAKQPRDPVWANKLEAALMQRILTAEPNKYSIRSIECRTTLCAINVDSVYGPYIGISYEFERSNGIFTWVGALGYEIDSATGKKITVSLVLAKKRLSAPPP